MVGVVVAVSGSAAEGLAVVVLEVVAITGVAMAGKAKTTNPNFTNPSQNRKLLAMKLPARNLVCLTAYTAPLARLADEVADIILVGDSVSMVLYGNDSTLDATMEMMERHGKAVVAATRKAVVVVDMPVGSYQPSPQVAYQNARLLLTQTKAKAVKLEGGDAAMSKTISHLTARHIAVMAHIGVLPQSLGTTGDYRKLGKHKADRQRLLAEAKAVEKAGAFAVVLENLEADLATAITKTLTIPTIGIGSGNGVRGQIAVSEDILGLSLNPPSFVEATANLKPQITTALKAYAQRTLSYPKPK